MLLKILFHLKEVREVAFQLIFSSLFQPFNSQGSYFKSLKDDFHLKFTQFFNYIIKDYFHPNFHLTSNSNKTLRKTGRVTIKGLVRAILTLSWCYQAPCLPQSRDPLLTALNVFIHTSPQLLLISKKWQSIADPLGRGIAETGPHRPGTSSNPPLLRFFLKNFKSE